MGFGQDWIEDIVIRIRFVMRNFGVDCGKDGGKGYLRILIKIGIVRTCKDSSKKLET